MLIRLYSPTGAVVHVKATQVVVLTDDGLPVALSAQEGRYIVHGQAGDADWAERVRKLGLIAAPLEEIRP